MTISSEHRDLLEAVEELMTKLAPETITLPSTIYLAYRNLRLTLDAQRDIVREEEMEKGIWTGPGGTKWNLPDLFFYDATGAVWHWAGGYEGKDGGPMEPLMSRNDYHLTDQPFSRVIENFRSLDPIVIDNPRNCEGFAWIGQGILHCDGCSLPIWQHEGMSIAEPTTGPFALGSIVQPWAKGNWVDQIRQTKGAKLTRIRNARTGGIKS